LLELAQKEVAKHVSQNHWLHFKHSNQSSLTLEDHGVKHTTHSLPVDFFDVANFLEPIEETLEVDDGSFKEQGIFFEHEGVPSTTSTHFLLGMWFLFLSECSKNKGKIC
jgi:hypothetical protein